MMTDDGSERNRKKMIDGLRNRRRFWKLNVGAEDQKLWKRRFISGT